MLARGSVLRICALAVLAFCGCPLTAAHAEYPERNIDLIIPYGPGGGFDLYARALAVAMDGQFPNGVKVIPRNLPGAGSIKGIATMYRAAPAAGRAYLRMTGASTSGCGRGWSPRP